MHSEQKSPSTLPEVSQFQGPRNPHDSDGLQYYIPSPNHSNAIASSYPASPDPVTHGYREEENIGRAPTAKSGRICSLRPTTFWLSVALAIVILIAAAVCGAVAGTRTGQKRFAQENKLYDVFQVSRERNRLTRVTSSCSSSSVTTARTVTATGGAAAATSTSGALTVPRRGVISLDCPNINGTTINRGRGYDFEQACDRDMLNTNTVTIDTMWILAYSLNDCLDACVTFNQRIKNRGCIGVEFVANLTRLLGEDRFGVNCFLKSGITDFTDKKGYGAVLALLTSLS